MNVGCSILPLMSTVLYEELSLSLFHLVRIRCLEEAPALETIDAHRVPLLHNALPVDQVQR